MVVYCAIGARAGGFGKLTGAMQADRSGDTNRFLAAAAAKPARVSKTDKKRLASSHHTHVFSLAMCFLATPRCKLLRSWLAASLHRCTSPG